MRGRTFSTFTSNGIQNMFVVASCLRISWKQELNSYWRTWVSSSHFIASVGFSVLRFGKCVILSDHCCGSYNWSFRTDDAILSNITLTRWLALCRMMFRLYMYWVMSMQNADLHVQAWSQGWGKCFLFISINNSYSDFRSYMRWSILPRLDQRTSV
jgi:hypothetical protein